MPGFLLYIILLFTALTGFAQKDSVRKYLDGDLHFTTKKNFVYPAMAIKNNDHWVLYAVYPDTTVLLTVFFKDAALTIKDGPFTLYHPKKIVAQKGNFKNNIPDGQWQTWYPGGQLKNEGAIINNHLSGTWKYWYENGQPMSERSYIYSDSMAGQPAHQSYPAYKVEKVLDDFAPDGKLEGKGTTWYENGNKESVLNYHNDSLSGVCAWFRENGSPSSKETYVNGKVTELECYNEEGKYTGSTCSILKLPVLIHPIFTAEDYIVNELHKEKRKDINEEGEAQVTFTITKNGTVKDLLILSSPDPALSKHIVQVFAAMPAWSPAVTHNRKIDYAVKLVIPYYRD
jgi:antitoxin component YwqK of YwqJK toxin-antitoxin module